MRRTIVSLFLPLLLAGLCSSCFAGSILSAEGELLDFNLSIKAVRTEIAFSDVDTPFSPVEGTLTMDRLVFTTYSEFLAVVTENPFLSEYLAKYNSEFFLEKAVFFINLPVNLGTTKVTPLRIKCVDKNLKIVFKVKTNSHDEGLKLFGFAGECSTGIGAQIQSISY